MKREELERIRALNAARTQELVRVGPLEGTTPEKWAQTVEQFAYISKAHGDADPQFWAVAIESPEQDGDVVTAMTGNGPTSKANAEFYAACHWAVPALLRHIEEVEGERDRALLVEVHGFLRRDLYDDVEIADLIARIEAAVGKDGEGK